MSVRKSIINKYEHSLENAISEFAKKPETKRNYDLFIWKLNMKITGCIHEHKKFGWMFFYSQITDLQLLKHYDWLISKLFQRFRISKPAGGIKSFFRTFHEIKHNLNNSNYFLNTDRMTADEMGDILQQKFEYQVPVKEEDIREKFFSVIYRSLKELEKDIQFFS